MADTRMPAGTASVTVTTVPTGKVGPTAHSPSGAGPAGTLTAEPSTSKVNPRPWVTPVPATLHTFTKPSVNRLVKVTTVWPLMSPATTRTVAVRAARSLATKRSAGRVATRVTVMPGRAASVIVTLPAVSWIGAEQAPTGTWTVRPPTEKKKVPVTPGPSAALQISRKPRLGSAVAGPIGRIPSRMPTAAMHQAAANRRRFTGGVAAE